MGRLIFDFEKCTGCRACELACSFRKDGVFAPSRSRVKVVRIDEEGLDIPIGCEHCDPAPCIAVCPTKALGRSPATDAVLLDRALCIGCKQCMVICPFGAIRFDEDSREFYKCDLCDGDPECTKWCFTGAIEHGGRMGEFPKKKVARRARRIMRDVRRTAGSGGPGGRG